VTRRPPDDGRPDRPPRIRPFLAGTPPREPPGPTAGGSPPLPDQPPLTGEEAAGPAAGALRPFVLTAGRVAGDADIELLTQVTTRVDDPYATYGLPSELRAIVALCAEPMSVAEISAKLGLHLGVTKILVGDLRSAGYLDVHADEVASPYDVETILRVIDGLRAFS
jgi:hypothetical protein